MKGMLYLVATPIGNLEDITLRAIRILKEVDVIVAEDTRHTLKLLNYFEIKKTLISYHRHSKEEKVEEIIELLKKGSNVALVSDAGTPVISDPGEDIVKKAIKNDIQIIPIPGACALICGLITSGLDSKEFTFLGFLSQNKKLKKEQLERINNITNTIILYEAPHKLLETLKDLEPIIDKRKVVLAREITKIHEEYIRGTIPEIINKIKEPKGEFVIIIEKNCDLLNEKERQKQLLNQLDIKEHYQYYEKQGYEKKEIIKKVAKDRNVHKNEIYQYFI